MAQHKCSQVALLLTNAALLVITVGINGLNSVVLVPGLFISNVGNISDKYYLDITPAGWTFTIWAFIYIAQFLFVGYSLSLICRKGPDNYLYLSPVGMIPNTAYVSYMLANIANFAWIFLWDREFIVASCLVIALAALALLIATGSSLRGLYTATPELKEAGIVKEIWLMRLLVHNSLAMYATWVSIATLINVGVLLVYVLGVPVNVAGTVTLGILAADLVLWFLVDVFAVWRYSNYAPITYAVFIVALTGSIEKNFVPWTTNSLFSVVLLVVAIGAFVVKVVTMLWRHCTMREELEQGEKKMARM